MFDNFVGHVLSVAMIEYCCAKLVAIFDSLSIKMKKVAGYGAFLRLSVSVPARGHQCPMVKLSPALLSSIFMIYLKTGL